MMSNINAHQQQINGRALEMFQSGEGADCVIEVQNDGHQDKAEFNVHKFVLMLSSDVFSAMFRHKNTKESRESRIQIKDSTPTAVHQMLIYMYKGGKLPKDYDIEKDAIPLLKIAHKYQIKSLTDLIGRQMVNSLSLTNVFDRMVLADLCQIDTLKSSCGQLIRRNLSVVKTNAKWTELKKKSPDLVISILEEFTDEVQNNDTPASPQQAQAHFRPLGSRFLWHLPSSSTFGSSSPPQY